MCPQAPRGSGKSGPGDSGLSIPDDQKLWDDLMTNKTEHGVPLVVSAANQPHSCLVIIGHTQPPNLSTITVTHMRS